ncbi:MAG: hypothetical protein Q8Q09_12170 [Deltaproteobacteria bacterium]|nr:hypothetical protein [Deltaproteobacteria bacterium]
MEQRIDLMSRTAFARRPAVSRAAIALTLATIAVSVASTSDAQTTPVGPARPDRQQPREIEPPPPRAAPQGALVTVEIPGEWQIRLWGQPELSLPTTPGASSPQTLGQTYYLEQWFRLRPVFRLGDWLSVFANFDLTRAILVGESTRHVELSRDARSTALTPFTHGIFDLRQLAVELKTRLGVLRAGHQLSHWGLGIVANSGDLRPVFGDYRNGDIVERVAFATRPGGRQSPWVVALAGDLVFRDRLASLLAYDVSVDRGDPPFASTIIEQPPTRTVGGDWAWQGIVSAYYQAPECTRECERKRVGMYAVYRSQTNREGDSLMAGFVDASARWEWPSPDGRATVFAAAELALAVGHTTIARSVAQPDGHAVVQHGGAIQLGVERAGSMRLVLEGGWASGDSNPADNVQRRFTFNPAHRVGLIMFPEVLAWHTARSASISNDPRLMGTGARGAILLPSSGAVTNAAYIYPTAIVDVTRWLDLRAGAVVGVSTSDLVDPVRSTIYGRSLNYRGGDARAKDLGLELDVGIDGHHVLPGNIKLHWGLQGAGFFAGHAFDNEFGESLPARWLGVVRVGLEY